MRLIKSLSLLMLLAFVCISCGGDSDSSSGATIEGVQGGQQVVSQEIIEAAQAQRDTEGETVEEIAEEVGVLSVEEVEVEELITEIEEEVEEEIDVATAEEDPLEGILNALSVFTTCIEEEGFEFVGVPGQPGPDGQVLNPEDIEPGYIEALQKCATESNILESFQTYSDAQANERGLLEFGQNGTGLSPPEGTDNLDPEDIGTCRSEAQAYTTENYVTEEE